MTAHHKIGWYMECRDHPRPDPPAGPYDATDPAWVDVDVWDDDHFRVGDDGILTCEANRVADACAECSERRCEREETSEAYVIWHGSASRRDERGRFMRTGAA